MAKGFRDPPSNLGKRSRASAAEVNDEDRISVLADDLILHVFSFLDIKEVVKTSTLSRRWSSLWTKTSAVTIDMGSFQDFSSVNQFFVLCTSPVIRKFHLVGPEFWESENFDLKGTVDLWIRFAIGRGVEDLSIEMFGDAEDNDYVSSRALFRCESLKWLKLRACEFPSLRDGVFMWIRWSSLRALSFDEMNIEDEVMNRVLEGSPLLESLTLRRCYGWTSIRISSRNMKELIIHGYFDPFDSENSRLEIHAPYLRSLRLLGYWVQKKVIVLKDVSSLAEVEMNFRLSFEWTYSDIILGTIEGILNKLRFVNKLVLGNVILVVLLDYKGNGDFPLRLHCRHLTVTALADRCSLGRIARALETAPNVEKLAISLDPKTYDLESPRNEDSLFHDEILKGKSWKNWTGCIKNIEITGFPYHKCAGQRYSLSLIKVLLRNAYVLEKMVINAEGEAHAQDMFEVAEGILGYRRVSKAAKVILNYPSKRRHS